MSKVDVAKESLFEITLEEMQNLRTGDFLEGSKIIDKVMTRKEKKQLDQFKSIFKNIRR